MATTAEILNKMMDNKELLKKYNYLKVLIPSTTLGKNPANIIPAVKSWLSAEGVELIISIDDVHIDMLTNIYQHYSRRILINSDSSENIDLLSRPSGKLALFNITKDDNNITNYAQFTLKKYENIINSPSIDDRNNIIIPIRRTPVVHVNILEHNRTLNEKYLEYRFQLLEFGSSPAYIFIKQIINPPGNPDIVSVSKNIVIGLEFEIKEKEYMSDARLAMIIKYISGLQILLSSI